eukprot:403362632
MNKYLKQTASPLILVAFVILAFSNIPQVQSQVCTGAFEEMFLGYARAIQRDPISTNTDCYVQATQQSRAIGKVMTQLQNFEFNLEWWGFIFQQLIAVGIENSDVAETCQQILFIKQLDHRLNSIPGNFNLAFTFLWNIIEGGEFRDSLKALLTERGTCFQLGYRWGTVLKITLQSSVASSINAAEISTFSGYEQQKKRENQYIAN